MSNLEERAAVHVLGGRGSVTATPVRELDEGRVVPLGGSTEVRRYPATRS